MTAGSGIIHQEMPQASPRMLGLQLWLNLPAKDKMTDPAYRDLTAAGIPVVDDAGSRVAIISGVYRGKPGAMKADYVDATMLDVALEPSASVTIPLPRADTALSISSMEPYPSTRERRPATPIPANFSIAGARFFYPKGIRYALPRRLLHPRVASFSTGPRSRNRSRGEGPS
jgi:hypothetical protein